MSCDYANWNTPGRLSSIEAVSLYNALCDGDVSGVSPNAAIDAFYAELTSSHPEINDIPEEKADDIDLCPWSIEINRSPGHLILCCVWPKAEYVKELVLSLAKKHGLAIFDPQTDQIYYPDIFYPDLVTLATEDEESKKCPDLAAVQAVVARMDLGEGPSYAILQGRGLDYAQCFGARGVFTVEWRDYIGIDFQHWRAGHPGQVTDGKAFVRGKTHKVRVRPGEQLSAADVLAILAAYLNGQDRPEHYHWRKLGKNLT